MDTNKKNNNITNNSTRDSNFSKITINLSSPERILEMSSGEVTKPETINYRTYKPEPGGLFCEKIFGPVKDYECACGKYKRIRYKGIVCDKCGVEVTEKKVRRDRTGHINLLVPVVHIWYFRNIPNKIGYLLGLPTKKLEMIIYYEKYLVIQPGVGKNKNGNNIEEYELLNEDEYMDIIESLPEDNQYLEDSNPDKFIAKMGAECIYDLLSRINIDNLSHELREKAFNESSKQRKVEALKRLQVVEAFRMSKQTKENKPEWMVLKVLPIIPPELRPLVALDGGRFASSDLNDLYRRVIIRNNRLKRLLEIKAPDVILRNEKRMLQEAVDSLLDNTKKASAVKTESNRPLKSLSDSLKGKQGRFRQNLLGKRVDYSGRSVIVSGPELKMHQCGLPKEMATELYKPFIIRKLIERGIVKTVKSAKNIIDNREAVVWEILENVIKGHPVLLNRAPTLHKLSIQAFQPKLIEGKAIRLHPLVCTAFNADFDGDQMAVHLPLSNEAILEAQLLMLSTHNILNPANGNPITVPSQDMVLGLYYMTKEKRSTKEEKVKGEGVTFYSSEEVIIAYNEKAIDLHACIKLRIRNLDNKSQIIDTTVGRVLFNEVVPKEIGYVNELLTKKSLRGIIQTVLSNTDVPTTANFLDDIMQIGFEKAFKGGLSFSLNDISVPEEKEILVEKANKVIDNIFANYNMGLITNNERYNQVIDVWTNTNIELTEIAMSRLKSDRQGFNSVYMMLDSGARGSKEQIRQLIGMRGLMAKPQKYGASGGEVIENPILSNFKEGLSILEYFISTHGARKGLADTALKTADAGYLTRRLVDVAQDVIVKNEDCGTLRGIKIEALKKNDEIIEPISERVLGRVVLNDIINPKNGEVILKSGEEITEDYLDIINSLSITSIDVRSALTCDNTKGICAKCYGRNLATGKMVKIGEAVGVVAAQSIGEPGTQLTLRTFHVGGTAGNISQESSIVAKYDGKIKIDDLKSIKKENVDGKKVDIVISRTTELKILDKNTGYILSNHNIPYGSELLTKDGDNVNIDDIICTWDPYNSTIISEYNGKVLFEGIEQNITYKVEIDEQTGFEERVIIESRNKKLIPAVIIQNSIGENIKYYNIPVGAYLNIKDNDKISVGDIIAKIPRSSVKSGDITGGLPRVTEFFEARNPSNPAIVSEIDGIISYGKIRRGNREIIIESKSGESRKYLVKTSNRLLVQENDYIKAGMPISDGIVTLSDILNIKGQKSVQEYLVNEIQEIYRLQGVKINDKHFEVIVRQMIKKVIVEDSGDTDLLEGQIINANEFIEINDDMFNKKVILDKGESTKFREGQIISTRELRDENYMLKRKNKMTIHVRDVVTATAGTILQGVTRASLQTDSFISSSSFQETTKVLNDAAIKGKVDYLLGLKENVIVGSKIPSGTGIFNYKSLEVESL